MNEPTRYTESSAARTYRNTLPAASVSRLQAPRRTALSRRLSPTTSASRGELDGDHITVLHHVVAPLEAQGAAVAGGGVAAGGDERLPADDLSADEALLDVRMD